MDITLIIVIILVATFIIGGTIAGHYATKASQKDAYEMNKKRDS